MGKSSAARPLAACATTAGIIGLLSAVLAPSASAADGTVGGPGAAGQPGLLNAITDVPGIQVGQIQAVGNGYQTGTTVVYAPDMAVAGVFQSGGAPGTKEMDLLDPMNSNPGVNAIAMTGGSAFGLDTTTGMMQWLEEHGEGVNVGAGVVPIVPGMVIFDLNRGGTFSARPTADWGYRVLEEASAGPVSQGAVGGGTGARSGGMKGGVGTASVTLDDGTVVGAIVVVNSVGSAVDPADCTLLAANLEIGDEFAGLKTPSAQECQGDSEGVTESLNTTIATVATNANLGKASAQRLAAAGQDGLTRAINPIHTLSDGDTVIGLSTGKEGTPLENNDPADTRALNAIYEAGANATSRAVVHAIINAQSAAGMTSYCDTYPSACADLTLEDPGTAVTIDPTDPLGTGGPTPTPTPSAAPTSETTPSPEASVTPSDAPSASAVPVAGEDSNKPGGSAMPLTGMSLTVSSAAAMLLLAGAGFVAARRRGWHLSAVLGHAQRR